MGPSQVFDAKESLLLLPEQQVPKGLIFLSTQERGSILCNYQAGSSVKQWETFQGVLNEIMNSLPQEAVSKAYTNLRGK